MRTSAACFSDGRLGAPTRSSSVAVAPFKKAIGWDMLPAGLPCDALFPMVVAAGFEGLEMEAVAEAGEAEEIRDLADRARLRIHSVVTQACWRHPLSAADPDEVRKGIRGVRTALDNARLWGADTILLVPAVVTATTSYSDAYARSQAVIRNELLPVAEELGIVLAIENVWNGFLLGPLEYVRYIDEFESPWVRAYLDVGNMIFGHPEHWVRIAGNRIARVHLKDFRLDRRRGRLDFGKLGDGDVDWKAVREALLEVGFSNYVTNTGIPRGRLSHWIARGVQFSRERLAGVPGAAGFDRALSAVRRRRDVLFLHDVARRFDRFRDGSLVQSRG